MWLESNCQRCLSKVWWNFEEPAGQNSRRFSRSFKVHSRPPNLVNAFRNWSKSCATTVASWSAWSEWHASHSVHSESILQIPPALPIEPRPGTAQKLSVPMNSSCHLLDRSGISFCVIFGDLSLQRHKWNMYWLSLHLSQQRFAPSLPLDWFVMTLKPGSKLWTESMHLTKETIDWVRAEIVWRNYKFEGRRIEWTFDAFWIVVCMSGKVAMWAPCPDPPLRRLHPSCHPNKM